MTVTVLDDILDAIGRWQTVVRVTVTHTLGSTPREAGADMFVGAEDFTGTIGGGKLEHLALEKARALLEDAPDGWPRVSENLVLGTELRQCCGGVAWLLFEVFRPDHRDALLALRRSGNPGDWLVHDLEHPSPLKTQPMPERGGEAVLLKGQDGRAGRFLEPLQRASAALVVYGAGHVGRALVRVLEGTPYRITWVDIGRERFPATAASGVTCIATDNPAEHAVSVEDGACHVVMTHSHALDLDICRAVLGSGRAGYVGLIASKTKRSKFINRLQKDGLPQTALDVFHSPIGMGDWSSKQPSVIAISIAAELMEWYEQALRRDRGPSGNMRIVGGRHEV